MLSRHGYPIVNAEGSRDKDWHSRRYTGTRARYADGQEGRQDEAAEWVRRVVLTDLPPSLLDLAFLMPDGDYEDRGQPDGWEYDVPGLSLNETKDLVKHLEGQGCTIRSTTNGWLIFFPENEREKSMTVHKTDSDTKAVMAMRARVLRAGLVWPGDYVHRKAARPERENAMGAPKGVRPENLKKLTDQIESLGSPSSVTTQAVARGAGLAEETVKAALYELGWHRVSASEWNRPGYKPEVPTYEPKKLAAKRKSPRADEIRELVIARLEELGHPRVVKPSEIYKPLKIDPKSTYNALTELGWQRQDWMSWTAPGVAALIDTTPEGVAIQDAHPEAFKPLSEAEIQQRLKKFDEDIERAEREEALPTGNTSKASTPPPPEPQEQAVVETVDTAWAVSLAGLPEDMTIKALIAFYEATGLNIELRAWRK